MQGFRDIRRDRLSAWLLTGLLAYVLLFQGLVSAYAKAAMAADAAGPQFVICSPLGTAGEADAHPFENLAKDCCPHLCQAMCGAGAWLPGPSAEPAAFTLSSQLNWSCNAAPRAPPSETGLVIGARGPPVPTI